MTKMTRQPLRSKLATMLFLQYFVYGAFWPTLSLHLRGNLGFSPQQVGVILSMSAVAIFVSPLIGAFVADRVIGSAKLLATCHFLGALAAFALRSQTQFPVVLALFLLYMLLLAPTIALTNAITFHHQPDARRNFGGIRLYGTLGWIVVCWVFGYFWLRGGTLEYQQGRLADGFLVAALASLVLGLHALRLPDARTRRIKVSLKTLIPTGSFRVFAQPTVMVLVLVCFMVSFAERFFLFGVSVQLAQLGFSGAHIMPVMSLAQALEIPAMIFLGVIIARLGLKWVMFIGLVAELIRFGILATGASTTWICFGLSLGGVAYCFLFTSAFICLDAHCGQDVRTGAHQLYSIINSGFGSLLGNLTAGWVAELCTHGETICFQQFWAVPGGITTVALVIMFLCFRDRPPEVVEAEEVQVIPA